MKTVTTNSRGCFIEVVHHDSDPSSWIVNHWTGIVFFRKRISSNRFIDKQQAFAHADTLKRAYENMTG